MMAVISTFDQWQKDAFFSTAEEVQESADTMESVYRMWARERCDGFESKILDELRRELHATLGTAKWQLEEFERAVSLSHENYPPEDNTITRHREFIIAIRNKISHVEKAINDSLLQEGKQPFSWVQLDEEERDDFEKSLPMAPQNLQGNKEKVVSNGENATINKDAKFAAAIEHFGNQDEAIIREDNSYGQPDWRIVIDDEEDVDKKSVEARPEMQNRASSFFGFLRSAESNAKLKWFRSSLKVKSGGEHIQSRDRFSDDLGLKRISLFSQGTTGLSERSRNCFSSCKSSPEPASIQQIRRVGGFQLQFLVSQTNKRSLRVTLLIVLGVFLIVPFVFYST